MKIKKTLISVLCMALIFSLSAAAVTETNSVQNDINPSTWAAVDGLGRTLSSNNEVGDKKQNKYVAMFYWTWHYPWINDHEPITTGSVLDKFPEAVNDWDHPAWGGTYDGRPYFWDEPLYGFYTNTDEYILRKHAELLADADIDAVFFDTTNGTQVFTEGYEALLKVWSKAKAEGVDVPHISFILNFGGSEETRTQLYDIYDNLYSKGRYSDLWFMWDGKPMLMADVGALNLSVEKDKDIFRFFTFRDNESTYFASDTAYYEDTWGWCSDYKQTKFGKRLFGGVEEMCVSVAQNANEDGLIAMNSPAGTVQGRSFTEGDFSYSYTYAGEEIVVDKSIENSLLYGLNFQQQWDYAISQDPEIIFVTGFNEWIAGRWENWAGTENAFPDQYNPEYSRDIEPSSGILKDHYYYQLVENVRRFKGASPLPKTDAEKSIDINGPVSQWDSVLPEYNHYRGGENRNSAGWKGYYYTNNTLRNDIIQSKIAYDSENIYFFVKTADNLTASTDTDWMRLLIDTDPSGISANWEGFEFLINRESPQGSKATLEKSLGGVVFEEVCKVDYTVIGNVLQISVPRNALGLTEKDVKFNFKWSDNLLGSDATAFYVNGDAAPGGRFAFVFDSTATGESEAEDSNDIFDLIKTITQKLETVYADLRKLYNNLFG
ncbi:MAG: hypothetical protein E7547_08750 [Ruminococcaceae bacterium]|nr:hypothetical protein [Oscillospiraceae bacterium]